MALLECDELGIATDGKIASCIDGEEDEVDEITAVEGIQVVSQGAGALCTSSTCSSPLRALIPTWLTLPGEDVTKEYRSVKIRPHIRYYALVRNVNRLVEII
ncbi:hypothetical protein Tcan_03197 [Toxocara canis]|uniref:Uncharacterized protein n=1 Tax=Toxocara canis TaxID=6265 RepID=A0A0B2W005_TOXCA|nr:hypothetical protein Tcan_03197 [Toxocara canis]